MIVLRGFFIEGIGQEKFTQERRFFKLETSGD